MTLILFTGCP